MKKIERATIIVLDSAGVGYLPDAAEFGDIGANTFGNISKKCGGLNIPNMEKMGIGNLTEIVGAGKIKNTIGAYGKAAEKAKGKDTTTGHWEIAGVIGDKPFPTYPDGFPKEVLKELEERTGRKILCNKPYSGTAVIDEYGEEQLKTGAWIVYTSADPVLQIAANEEIIPLDELYKACEIALEICMEKSPVARVIARPYVGKAKREFERTSNRHDYSVKPPRATLLDKLKSAGKDVVAIGKISDIFAGEGITDTRGTNQNDKDGILKTITALKEDSKGLIFTNLVDFDMKFGHRRDPQGYKEAIEQFDRYLPEIMENLKDDEILIVTADHGCDPTYQGTDHTREYIPILVYGKEVKGGVDLGIRESFGDIAATLEELLLGKSIEGSFAKELY
ncbi:phosphopentomutase [Ilyobacter polytropus]|uniref:Phosphopentomutase n=1 Tax=Ilyobacter polytropus (strain ATCC 51220 / DSM 2926 / LMG 16218 / CuHBu1) TaxID=572544 RepID=E3H810_ILYPC|nr:phosphopentomutase [Ilyobacter polytropus]ADO83241.1 phosphopentomutase [Ilyobacter polytropus DSM 2926]